MQCREEDIARLFYSQVQQLKQSKAKLNSFLNAIFSTWSRKYLPAKKRDKNKGVKRWVSSVTTESTFPQRGIFTKDAETIARHMGSKKVSPKGIGSGIRMIQYFINRAGKSLPASRRRELEKAKRILQSRQKK